MRRKSEEKTINAEEIEINVALIGINAEEIRLCNIDVFIKTVPKMPSFTPILHHNCN